MARDSRQREFDHRDRVAPAVPVLGFGRFNADEQDVRIVGAFEPILPERASELLDLGTTA